MKVMTAFSFVVVVMMLLLSGCASSRGGEANAPLTRATLRAIGAELDLVDGDVTSVTISRGWGVGRAIVRRARGADLRADSIKFEIDARGDIHIVSTATDYAIKHKSLAASLRSFALPGEDSSARSRSDDANYRKWLIVGSLSQVVEVPHFGGAAELVYTGLRRAYFGPQSGVSDTEFLQAVDLFAMDQPFADVLLLEVFDEYARVLDEMER